MKTIEVELPDQTAAKLLEAAQKLSVTPEHLVQISVEEKLSVLEKEFRAGADYVLDKNQELYRRLA